MAKHAVLSASGAYRWLACPGSIRLCDGLPQTTSIYAQEGTAAHKVAEKCLRMESWKAADLLGGIISVDGKPFDVTQDMVDAVQVYLDTIKADFEQGGRDLMWEHQFHLNWLYPDLYGTNDALISEPFGLLRVYDYKHGAGVAVEAEDNSQLMYYALGAIGPKGGGFEEVELVIVQPRAVHPDGPIRRCRMPVGDLLKWANEVLLPGAKATENPGAPLVSGDHCRFCNALAHCPAQREMALSVAQDLFTEVPTRPPDPQTLAPSELKRIISAAPMVEAWLDAVRIYAKSLLETGMIEPAQLGYKLVSGRSTRSWADEDAAAAFLVMVLDDDAYVPKKLISPAQAEKILKGPENKKAIATMVKKSEGGTSMVPLSDKREAIIPAIAAFEEVLDI